MSIEKPRFNIESVEGDKPEEENITNKELNFENRGRFSFSRGIWLFRTII